MTSTTVVRSITISDGTNVAIPENGVVLFVGPNNAGKSQALRDIAKLVTSPTDLGVVVTHADVEFRGSSEDLLARFTSDRSIISSATSGDKVNLGASGQQAVSSAISWWNGASKRIVGGYFVLLADTESRLKASHPTPALDLYSQSPQTPLHRLYLQPDLERRLAAISRGAFRQSLILDVWAGGSQWALRVGSIEAPNSPRPDQAYLDELRDLPLLHDEGDGVRSMIGLLLTLLTGHQTISLVDEPEAFLHPPQARYLAKLLSEDSATEQRAVFLSTHSSEIVHGTLEGPAPTTVIRLRRAGDRNEAAVLDNDAVRRLWSDPLLRYSNLLEGLFTDAVVVCESEADCKFFASIRDSLDVGEPDSRRPDVLFTSCGGKHRMHVGVEALRAASVPVAVIGDFDVLNEWSTLSRLIVKAGADPSQFEANWRTLNAALTSTERTPSVVGLREAVNAAFDAIDEVTAKSLAPVKEALKIERGWDRVKNTGLQGVPKSAPRVAAKQLLEDLQDVGIFLIPIGEMEDFIPTVGDHGGSWLAQVLEHRKHESSEGDGARKFLKSVLEAVSRVGAGDAAREEPASTQHQS